MTVTFKDDNDIVVYALEKVIAYARRTQQIFVAHCVWWLASIIGLEQELINHIDKLQSQIEVRISAELLPEDTPCAKEDRDTKANQDLRGVSITPRDIQEDPRSRAVSDNIHPDRQIQIQVSVNDISSSDIEETRQANLVQGTEKFISLSRKERKEITKRNQNNLSKVRSQKVVKPVTKKQRNYLQSLSKDSIVEYLKDRK
jgi:hypothetical protein